MRAIFSHSASLNIPSTEESSAQAANHRPAPRHPRKIIPRTEAILRGSEGACDFLLLTVTTDHHLTTMSACIRTGPRVRAGASMRDLGRRGVKLQVFRNRLAGERLEERDQILDLLLGQVQRHHPRVLGAREARGA